MRIAPAAFMRGFIVALLAIAWTIGFLPTPAFAACPDNTSAWIVKTQGVANNEYGVMVGQSLVINPSTDCGIVRSIYVKDSNINTVEVGGSRMMDREGSTSQSASTSVLLMFSYMQSSTTL